MRWACGPLCACCPVRQAVGASLTRTLGVMNNQRTYIRASLLAPLIVAAPLLALSTLAWAFMNLITDGDAPFHLAGVGILAALPIYIAGAVCCYVVALALAMFWRLSQATLTCAALVLSALISVLTVSVWLQVPGGLANASSQLIFFFILSFVWLSTTLLTWWCLAASKLGPNQLLPLRSSLTNDA